MAHGLAAAKVNGLQPGGTKLLPLDCSDRVLIEFAQHEVGRLDVSQQHACSSILECQLLTDSSNVTGRYLKVSHCHNPLLSTSCSQSAMGGGTDRNSPFA